MTLLIIPFLLLVLVFITSFPFVMVEIQKDYDIHQEQKETDDEGPR